MPLTVTQANILRAHLVQMHKTLSNVGHEDSPENFRVPEILASLIHELGPFVVPDLSLALARQHLSSSDIPDIKRLDLLGLLDRAQADLQTCIDTHTMPGRSFREIIAALLQEFAPIIIQAIIAILLQPEPDEA